MGDGHPHPACTVYGIEVSKADLLALWPGTLKRPSARRPNLARLLKQAEASGHPVTSVTTRDGTTLHFSEVKATDASNPWLAAIDGVKK
jgi:hypothetical protein